jgi:hypothetical protein
MQQQFRLQIRQRAALVITVLLLFIVSANVAVLAQNMGAAPQVNVAVQGQTGAQPEGAFLNLVNWIGNVIAPVGAGLALAGGLVSYVSGRGVMRYVVTALGCLAVSGVTRLLEFWIQQGGGGVS